ncbi:hypothetical protein AAC387_Pa12g0005 [Persea americana]
MVYDNIGHGADHCFPPPGYKRPKSMKRTDGVGPVGRRTNGRRTVCGKDVRASCCCLCPAQSAPAAAASVRVCVRAAASAVCSQHVRLRRPCVQPLRPFVRAAASAVCSHPVLLQRLFVRAAASAMRACCCVCSCVQPRRSCVRAAAASSVRAAASAVCSQHVLLRRPCVPLLRLFVGAAASAVRACSCVRSCVQLRRPFVRAAASRFVNVGRSYISAPRRGRSLFALSFVPPSTKRQAPSAKS